MIALRRLLAAFLRTLANALDAPVPAPAAPAEPAMALPTASPLALLLAIRLTPATDRHDGPLTALARRDMREAKLSRLVEHLPGRA